MNRLLWATLLLFSQLLAAPAYGQFESYDSNVEFCKWLSILARDVMTARQKNTPMSETLPWAVGRLPDMLSDMGIDVTEWEYEAQVQWEEHFQGMKLIVSNLVMEAYGVPALDSPNLKRDSINEFENLVFSACYLAE
jgi:hypothetical protein